MFWLKNRTILICADANPRIGTRHVRRCLNLAGALANFGFQTHLLTPNLPLSLQRKIKATSAVHWSDKSDGIERRFVQQIEAKVRELEPVWAVIDGNQDLSSFDHHAMPHMLFLDDASGWARLAMNDQPSEWLDEPKYAITDLAEGDVQEIKSRVRQIVWIMNQDLPVEIRAGVLKQFQQNTKKRYSFDLIVRREVGGFDELKTGLVQAGHSLRVHASCERLEPLIRSADVAIVSDCDWLAELSSQNVPVLYLASGDDESAAKYSAKGAIEFVGGEQVATEVARSISRFFNNTQLRRNRSQNSFRLFDGLGAERIVRAIAGSAFHFRKCTMEDRDCLLNWRNDPEFRAVCFDSQRIEPSDHYDWLQQRLASEFCEIFVIENQENKPVGQFRLEYDAAFQTARLNLGLVPSLRGMGIGTALIERASRYATSRRKNLEVYANIRANNVISTAAFRKSGFHPDSTLMVNGQVAVRYSQQRYDADTSSTDAGDKYLKAS